MRNFMKLLAFCTAHRLIFRYLYSSRPKNKLQWNHYCGFANTVQCTLYSSVVAVNAVTVADVAPSAVFNEVQYAALLKLL